MVFPWFSHGFPMVFPWFSHGFPMVFPWFSHGFPMVFLVDQWKSPGQAAQPRVADSRDSQIPRSLVLLSKMGPSKGRGPLNTKRAPRLKKGPGATAVGLSPRGFVARFLWCRAFCYFSLSGFFLLHLEMTSEFIVSLPEMLWQNYSGGRAMS